MNWKKKKPHWKHRLAATKRKLQKNFKRNALIICILGLAFLSPDQDPPPFDIGPNAKYTDQEFIANGHPLAIRELHDRIVFDLSKDSVDIDSLTRVANAYNRIAQRTQNKVAYLQNGTRALLFKSASYALKGQYSKIHDGEYINPIEKNLEELSKLLSKHPRVVIHYNTAENNTYVEFLPDPEIEKRKRYYRRPAPPLLQASL